MGSLSLRIPDELVAKLEQEAELEQRGRSEIVREALDRYLEEKSRERFLSDLVREARAVYSHPAARKEASETAQDFLPVENETLERVAAKGRGKGRASAARGQWWK